MCDTILHAAGSAVRDELKRHTQSNHPGSIFRTSAGSITNVRHILHIIPTSTDSPGLQSSLEQLLDFVKSLSLSSVLFPIAATMSLKVSPSDLLKRILRATENCGIYDSIPLKIVVLVGRISEFDNLKSLFNDVVSVTNDVHVHDSRRLQDSDDKSTIASCVDDDDVFSQETPSPSPMSKNQTAGISKSDKDAQISIPATKRNEDKISLHFVGFQPAVNNSVSDVSNFVERNKGTKRIEIRTDGLQLCQQHLEELDNLFSIYHVLINLRKHEITVEGIKNNVLECQREIIRLQNKYESNENKIGQPIEEINEKKNFEAIEVRSDIDEDAISNKIGKDFVV